MVYEMAGAGVARNKKVTPAFYAGCLAKYHGKIQAIGDMDHIGDFNSSTHHSRENFIA